MKKLLKKITTEKGQGLTEYVLILAFVAGVAFMMFGGNGSLKDTLVNTITETNSKLAGLFKDVKYADMLKALGKKPLSDIKNEDNANRIAADQEALANIAKYFIDNKMTKGQVKAILGFDPSASNLMGGGLIANYFDYYTDPGMEGNPNVSWLKAENGFNKKNGNLTDLFQGGYDSSANTTYDLQSRFFFSDNMINDTYGNGDQYLSEERSIRIAMQFSGPGDDATIESARVRVNRGPATKDMNGSRAETTYSYFRELDVTVDKNGNYSQTIKGDPGPITVKESMSYNYSNQKPSWAQ